MSSDDRRSTRAWLCTTTALCIGFSALTPPAASAQSGLQITPDGRQIIVSKDVGAERWAIAMNKDDASVTGNVFFPEGGEPLFVWCSSAGVTPEGDLAFDCFGADQCNYGPCGEAHWSFIASVSLPESFFQAPAGPMTATRASLGTVAGAGSERESGAQVTADENSTLISKDVGGERWAISRNHDDGTVVGNVFKPGGGEPSFVWCEETAAADGNATYRCLGADICTAAPCLPDQWSVIAEVTLPQSFFAPPTQISFETVVLSIFEELGDEGGHDAILLALDRGCSIDQVIDAGVTKRLNNDGRIRRRDGGFEEPDGEPLAFLLSTEAATSLGSTADNHGSLERARQTSRQGLATFTGNSIPEDLLPGVIMILVNSGYTAEDILTGLTTGSVGLGLADDGTPVALIRDESGNLVSRPRPPSPPTSYDPFPPPGPAAPCNHDGVKNDDEACDGADLGGETCESLEGKPGVLKCYACTFSRYRCGKVCGDGVWDIGEECDGADLSISTCKDYGYDRGELRCTSECKIDTSGCEELCGNGAVEPEYGERCEGNDFAGSTCVSLGYASGELACSKYCRIRTTGCEGCGNDAAHIPEDCDGPDLAGGTCERVGFPLGGDLGCTAACTYDTSGCMEGMCGDGRVEGDEDCDGGNLAGETCGTQGLDGGNLACSPACRFDFSGCSGGACGNSVVEAGEACDGPNLGGSTCSSEGFGGGTLACDAGCQLDTSACLDAGCGDGAVDIQSGEECDGANLNGQSCEGLGLAPGELACSSCQFDISGCGECGNDEREGGEECDGADLGGTTCDDFEDFTGGDLACDASCSYDTSGCTSGGECGDGAIDDGEQCDGAELGGISTCDQIDPTTYFGGPVGCSSCQYDTSQCELDAPPVITDLQFPAVIDGFFAIGGEGTLDFADPNGDIVFMAVERVSGNFTSGSGDPGLQGQTSGTFPIALFCGEDLPEDYTVEWHLRDSRGNESNRWRHSFRCEE